MTFLPGFSFVELAVFLVGLATLIGGWITGNKTLTAIGTGMIAGAFVMRAIASHPEVLVALG